MSWRGKKYKRKAVDDEERAPKRNSYSSSSSSSENIFVCEISKNRRVSVRAWQGKPVVDIREFYVKDGKDLPGNKGISLNMDQWKILREHVNEIDEAVADNS